MSKRVASLLLEDILECISKIEGYTQGLKQDTFETDRKTIDAVVRNLEIIGEAANSLPESYRKYHNEIEWPQIIGLRHRIIHEYFDVDVDIIWFIVQNELAPLKWKVEKLLHNGTKDSDII